MKSAPRPQVSADGRLFVLPDGRTIRRFAPDGDVLKAFMRSPALAKVIQGPIGSGKSLVCAMLIWLKATQQKVQADGKRRCRAHVFRDSYPKLEETTLKTWLDWFPEDQYGKFYRTKPFLHEIRVDNIELDVHFVALEDQWAADFFRSLETTICWFNEVQYMDRVLFDEAVTRVGRYPKVLDGGAVGPQVIADMNAPDETHWAPIMRGDVAMPDWFTDDQRRAHVKPPTWEFFIQPPGLIEEKDGEGNVTGYKPNPKAENLKFLPPGYYQNAAYGKSKSWIDANILNKVSPRRDGKPVFKDFNRAVHVAKQVIEPARGVEILGAFDFGRRPALVLGQNIRGSWYVFDEIVARDMGAAQFAPLVKNHIAIKYPGFAFKFWGDPSGDFKGQNDETTPFRIMAANGIRVMPAMTQEITVRLQSVEAVLTRMAEGKPSLLISPTCTTLIAALDGGYHFRRMKVSGGERYSELPEKDEYSDVADALQYLVSSAGEGRRLLSGTAERAKPVDTKRPFRPFAAAGVRGW